jgi:hypothetical protein
MPVLPETLAQPSGTDPVMSMARAYDDAGLHLPMAVMSPGLLWVALDQIDRGMPAERMVTFSDDLAPNGDLNSPYMNEIYEASRVAHEELEIRVPTREQLLLSTRFIMHSCLTSLAAVEPMVSDDPDAAPAPVLATVTKPAEGDTEVARIIGLVQNPRFLRVAMALTGIMYNAIASPEGHEITDPYREEITALAHDFPGVNPVDERWNEFRLRMGEASTRVGEKILALTLEAFDRDQALPPEQSELAGIDRRHLEVFAANMTRTRIDEAWFRPPAAS